MATLAWLKAKKFQRKHEIRERKWERLTWVEARKQSVLGSISGRSHLEDTVQNRSPLQGRYNRWNSPIPVRKITLWITAMVDKGVRPFTGACAGAVG